jgi:hypothetical protein
MNSHEHNHTQPRQENHIMGEENHKIFIPNPSIFKKLTLVFKLVDDLIYQMYSSLVGNFDVSIYDMEISKFLKNILHSRQILFFYIIFGNFWMIYSNITFNMNTSIDHKSILKKEEIINFAKYFFYLLCHIFFAILLFLTIYLKIKDFPQMRVKRYNELEQYILTKNKELKKNECSVCNVVKCMRSFHCNYCNKCVTKFELHSHWLNTCIGSQNFIIYVAILLFLNLFFIICLLNYFLQIFIIDRDNIQYDFKFKLFYLHFWFILTLYLEFKLFRFTYSVIRKGLLCNLTENERKNWLRLPYLWRNSSKEFFNPFDRGSWNNFKDVWASWRNKELDISDRINIELMKNENLNVTSEILDVCQAKNIDKSVISVNSTEDDFVFLNNESLDSKTHGSAGTDKTKESVDKFQMDYFITSDEQICYLTYDPKNFRRPINWTRIRIYTIFDLINSPFRKIFKNY